MTNLVLSSVVTQQLAVLHEALEDQKISPCLEMDLKCVEEMKKLLAILEETGKSIGFVEDVELNTIYTILENSKESYRQGLERLSTESFAARFFYVFSKAPWEVGEIARGQIVDASSLEGRLTNWVRAAEAGENRLEAKNRILICLNTKSSSLSLKCLGLKVLPDIFDNLTALTDLDVSINRLETLPESISNLTSLNKLSVSNNWLTAWPEIIDNLSAINSLNVSGNQLETLPESIGNLTALRFLSIGANHLTALPESIGNLINLTGLYASYNRLIVLPESIGNLAILNEIIVSDNQLTVLPESIGNLRALNHLLVYSNRLTTLPESIRNLTELTVLSVSYNRLIRLPQSIGNLIDLMELRITGNSTLTSIPNEILQLPFDCTVDLSGCGLSQTVLTNLHAAVTAPGYYGPGIQYSILEPRRQGLVRALPALFHGLSKITGRTLLLPTIQSSSDQGRLLRMWLGRLSDLADYKSGGEKKRGIANNVQDYLQKANDDPLFREVFYVIIQDATETCGDRVALSLVHLGIAHDLSKIEVRDMKKLANFLIRGVFVMGLLEDAARAKVESLSFVDEIEVYLGYPVMLKERLQLPINISQMLYAMCSNITEQDLTAATSFVNAQIGNEETVCKFLVKQNKWKEALLQNYPKEMKNLKAQRDRSLEKASSSVSYLEIESRFNAGLVELTRRVL